MTTLTNTTRAVTGGVDTHGQTHHAAVLDDLGRPLGDQEFPTTPVGYRGLLRWLQTHGHAQRVEVEGTGSYGAALSRHLRAAGIAVVEVDRPDRKARRAQGKSDPLDALSARAALTGVASGIPKARDGRIEAIRALRVARQRGQGSHPDHQSAQDTARQRTGRVARAAAFTSHHSADRHLRGAAPRRRAGRPRAATKTALRRLARRHQYLSVNCRYLRFSLIHPPRVIERPSCPKPSTRTSCQPACRVRVTTRPLRPRRLSRPQRHRARVQPDQAVARARHPLRL